MSEQQELEIDEEALEREEAAVRQQAKKLFSEIEVSYWDLAKCLYSVFDGLPDSYRGLNTGDGSRARRQELFKKWGYKSFADYCEKELGLRKRTAENLRYVYYYFEVKLRLPREVIEQIKKLGRSKAYMLAGIVTEDNVISWIEKAKTMTFDVIKEEIKLLKQSDTSSSVEEGSENLSDDIVHVHEGLPAPEELKQFHTAFYPEQVKTVDAALARAEELSGSDKKNHNLDLISQDFLLNNEFRNSKEEDKRAYLRKMENLLGVHLIALDPSTGLPLYNGDLLYRMLEENTKTTVAVQA
jgi:hypothetical protein